MFPSPSLICPVGQSCCSSNENYLMLQKLTTLNSYVTFMYQKKGFKKFYKDKCLKLRLKS